MLLAAAGAALGGFFGAVFGLGLAAVCRAAPKTVGGLLVEPLIRWFRHRRYVATAALALCTVVPPVALLVLRYLRQGTGPCTGCVTSTTGGISAGGGGGRR